MLDVGDTKRLEFRARDADGLLVDPTSVVLTVTLPDGTTATPSVDNPPAETGIFTADYVTEQYGRHVARWVASSPNIAYTDVFSAADPDWPVLVGLAEAKKHLNYDADDTSDDQELRGFIASASAVVEDVVGVTGRRTITETNSGGEAHIVLSYSPVLEVTSIEVDGEAVDAADYTVSPSGLIMKDSGCWSSGFHNVEVVYVAGRVAVPASVHDATLELIRINWRPQAGGNYSPFDGGSNDDFGGASIEASLQGNLRLGFFIPNTVTQRLQPNQRAPVVL